MDRTDWDARYRAKDLVWGTEPNRFVAAELGDVVAAGRALDLACGEGRNAIWLASRGWQVTAVDFSPLALERGRKLATERDVELEWVETDVTTFAPESGAYALVLILYLQVPASDRARVLDHAAEALAASGELLMVGHAVRNLTEGWGGPQSTTVLWDPDQLRAEVEARGLCVVRSEQVLRPVETDEGEVQAIDVLLRAKRD